MNDIEQRPDFDGHNRGAALTVGLSPLWLAVFGYLFHPLSFGSDPFFEGPLLSTVVVYVIVGLLTLAQRADRQNVADHPTSLRTTYFG